MIRVATDVHLKLVLNRLELIKALDLALYDQFPGWSFYLYVDRGGVEINSAGCSVKIKRLLDEIPFHSTTVIVVEYGKLEFLYNLLKELREDEIAIIIDDEFLILETPSLYKAKVGVFIKDDS